jgi:hypothetical protein
VADDDAREVRLGSVLVSLLDPPRGDEIAFNRWYERDHFYAGCMAGPWFFAGRRFVATRELKALRHPDTSNFIADHRAGSYLALYWLMDGRHRQAERWAVDQVNRLIAADRMHPGRRPVHAGFYHYTGGVFRDRDGVPAELALDHPYRGAILIAVERSHGVDAKTFEAWLRHAWQPRLAGTRIAMALALEPLPLPDAAPSYVERPGDLERRTLLVAFSDCDPHACWTDLAARCTHLDENGPGRVSWVAPFVPTIPGTDRYADDLW